MNSKGHLIISLVKSSIRIISGLIALAMGNVAPLAYGVIFAEIAGVLEELVDKR